MRKRNRPDISMNVNAGKPSITEDTSVIKILLRYAGAERKKLILVLICSVIASSAEIAAPFFTGLSIDKIAGIGQVDFPAILKFLIIIGILYLIYSVFSYFVSFLSYRCAHKIVGEIRSDAFDALSKLPLSYFDKSSGGDVISRFVNDATAVADGLMEGITQIFAGLVTILGTLIFMLFLSPAVTGVVIVVTSLTFLVARGVTKYSNRHFKSQQVITGEMTGLVGEMVGGIHTVKAFSYEKTAEERFAEINERLYTAGQKSQFAGSLTNPTTRFVNYLAYISVGVVGGIVGGLSAGRISSFIIYSSQFAKPFNQLTAIVTQILAAYAAAGRVFELMREKPEAADPVGAIDIDSLAGQITFDGVYFAYDPARPLIEDFSMSISPGTRVAIVGPTGAGKTTLVSLIMRFYEINGGAILMDGLDTRQMTRPSLRRQIGMVLQETWLFEGTVKENIAYGHPSATEQEIIAAAKSAHAHSFIKRLPFQYDTMLDADGGNLSAGQKQLLTIARAMLTGPDILVLDEATSSIDTLTEQRITRAFNKMMDGTTSFIIAHRLSTIRDADVIIVMDAGHIVEQGSHDELLEKNGFYANLYNSQFVADEV